MGRIFNNTTTPKSTGGGRIFRNQQTPTTGRVNQLKQITPLQNPVAWESMSFGQKAWVFATELPQTLYHLLPQAIREGFESPTPITHKQALLAGVVGAGQFTRDIAQQTVQGTAGAVLTGVEKITKKEQRYQLPILGEVSSYQQQAKDLKEAGFSDEESAALVGINAYLSIIPFATKALKTTPVKSFLEHLKTQETELVKTKAGIREQLLGKKPEELTQKVREERPLVTKTKELLKKTDEDIQFNEILTEHQKKYFEGRDVLTSREDPLNKKLLSLGQEELSLYSDYTQGFQVPQEKITPKLKSAVDEWKKVNQEIETDLIKRKKLSPEVVENRKWKPVEQITGRTRQELIDMGVEPIYYPYVAETSLKKSDFLPSLGKRTKGGYLKRFTGKMLAEDSYLKDPRVAIPRNRLQVFRDKMNEELVNTVRDTFAEKNPRVIQRLKKNASVAEHLGLVEWKPSGNLRFYPLEEGGVGVTKRVESYWIPETVAKELNKFSKPGIIEKTLRMTYDPLIDLWRVSVLHLMPRWVYNNLLGNSFLYVLGKGDPFALLYKAPKELFARTKVGKGLKIKTREIPSGIINKQYTGGTEFVGGQRLGSLPGEITQVQRPIENWLNLLEQAKKQPGLSMPATITQNIIKGYIALGKPIGKLNTVTENWFRTALYISETEGKILGLQLDKPVPPAQALKYVNEFLFDYTKLSRAERATFRRALPFYNWIKNITEFSLKFPAKHPIRALTVNALLQEYVDYIETIDQKEDKQRSVLRLKTTAEYQGKPIYINLRSSVPFSDVFGTLPTPRNIMKLITGNPVGKFIFERAARINAFTGQPFTQPEEMVQYDEFGKEIRPLPPVPQHIGQQIPQVKMIQQIKDFLQYDTAIKRYDTGQPKMFRNKIQTEDIIIDILKYFGISLSPVEYNEINRSVDIKERKQTIQQKQYERILNRNLENLKSRVPNNK